MRGCQDVLKTVGVCGEKCLRLFGNVRGMIVQDDSDGAFRRIPRVEIGQQADEFDAAVTVLHACRDVPVLEIQRCQYGNRTEPLVCVVAPIFGYLPGTGGRSGAVLAMACTPGFSSTETVIMPEAASPAARLAFCNPTSWETIRTFRIFASQSGS